MPTGKAQGHGRCIASSMVILPGTLACGCRALIGPLVGRSGAASSLPRYGRRRESGGGTSDNWLLRQDMECEVCKAERRRRCCVLRSGVKEDEDKLLALPFAAAPFVHPFRHPSYHATQLRTIVFAKSTQKRLLWVAAFDKVVSNALDGPAPKQEQRKERCVVT